MSKTPCTVSQYDSCAVAWQVRGYPCNCQWPEHCDSQQSSLPPTRMAQKAHQSQPSDHNSVQLYQGSIAPQQPGVASATSSDSLQSASDSCPIQPLEQSPVGRQAEAGATSLGLQPCDDLVGKPQLAARQNGSQDATEADLQRLEQEFVHDVYNAIAPHFSATRFAIWPKVPTRNCAPALRNDCQFFLCQTLPDMCMAVQHIQH